MALKWGNGLFLFEKILSETDIKHRLAFPAQHLHHLIIPNNPTPISGFRPIRVIDGSGNEFVLHLKLRREGHPKPEMTGDWLRFVSRKELKPGDRVRFYIHPTTDNNKVKFTITVRKQFWLFRIFMGILAEA